MESTPTVQDLFKRWRNEGDAQAGMEMAQKFSDWYYAVTAARLGDRDGRQALEAACQAFEQGIVRVTRTSDLVDWAYGLVDSNLQSAGNRVPGGDFPNALTGNRSPTALLQAVRSKLSPVQVELLSMTFDQTTDLDSLSHKAEAAGGMPHAILQSRYALKRHLRDHAQVPLQVVPDRPNLDLAPLPLYEAARMHTGEEEAAFEKWLLSDIELCKDVAEFAAFAHALRGGAFSGPAAAIAQPTDQPEQPEPAAATAPGDAVPVAAPVEAPVGDGPPAESRSMLPLVLGLILVFLVVVCGSLAALLL